MTTIKKRIDFYSIIYLDNSGIPDEVQKVFERVRANADFMPEWQMKVSAKCVETDHYFLFLFVDYLGHHSLNHTF